MILKKEGGMKRFVFFVLSLVLFSLPVSAQVQNLDFEIAKLISEIKVSEMDALNKSGATNIINLMKLVEQTVFKMGSTKVAKEITAKSGDVDQGYCLLNTDISKLSSVVLNEYHADGIKGDDVYIAMGLVLALEQCGIFPKEHRRELYDLTQKGMMHGILNYSSPDYEGEMHLKSEYYEY